MRFKSQSSKKINKLFVLCFPHLGTLDNWMPIVNSINSLSNNLNFTLIIPDPNILKSFDKDNAVIEMSDSIFKSCLIYAYDDLWIEYRSVFDSMKWYDKNRVFLRIFNIFKNLMARRFFSYILMWPSVLLRNYIYKNKFKFSLCRDVSHMDILLYDIHVENNSRVSDILQLFYNKYSLPHALSMLSYKGELPKLVDVDNKDNIEIYMYAEFQKKHYISKYGINLDKTHVVGIPRHDCKWIKMIQEKYDKAPDDFNDNSILILSRHASNGLLLFNDKLKSVKNIKKLFIDKLGMKVVIKLHPNEKQEKILFNKKENIYENEFGIDNYGLTWIYSDLHVFSLGKGKKLAISFNTGVVLDLIAMGVPCIEYIESSTKFEKNMTEFTEYEFITRASNYQELCVYVDKWLINPYQISELSTSVYKKYFPIFNNSPDKVAIEILHNIKTTANA